jgi:hypothetical protein
MLKRIPKNAMRELRDPGDREETFGMPGSIELQLDMCEAEDEMRGDDVIRSLGRVMGGPDQDPVDLSEIMSNNFRMDLSEDDREGDEMSGDEHSSGLQGGEESLEHQLHLSSGLPGNRTQRDDAADIIVYSNPEDQEDRAEIVRHGGQLTQKSLRNRQR